MHACRAQPGHRHLRDIVDLREPQSMLASDDDGFVTNYWYDADGESSKDQRRERAGICELRVCRHYKNNNRQ